MSLFPLFFPLLPLLSLVFVVGHWERKWGRHPDAARQGRRHRVEECEKAHPTVKGAENFCYEIWPVDENVYLDFQIWNADSRESGNWTRHKVYPIILALFLVIWRVSFASNSTVFIWKWGISMHLSFSSLLYLWYHASPQLPPNISIHGYVFRN